MAADLTGLGTAAEAAKGIIGMFFPDKTEAEKAQLAASLALIQSQTDTNKEEAKSSSLFVAGWRPAIGWVCGASLAYTFICYPLLLWASAAWFPELKPPALVNDGMLFELLLGMLGLGGLRTYEKVRRVAS